MKNETIGGVLLVLGVLIFLVTVYFEIQIGWIGSPESHNPEFVPYFLKDNWDEIKSIWGWQAFANFLFTLAYFHLAKISRNFFGIPLGSCWAVLFILSFMVLVCFGITLGAYEPALRVYDSNPGLFQSIRGAVLGLFGFGGAFGQFILLLIFLFEVFAKQGVMPKKLGLVVLGILSLFLVMLFVGIIPGKLIGLTFLLMPLALGFAYLRQLEKSKFEND